MARAPKRPAEPPRPNYITPVGLKKLGDELHRLHTVDRRKVVREVSDAAALGDRSENAEYIYGKRKLREIDRRLEWLAKRIDSAVVVDPKESRGKQKIFFGATVVVEESDGEEREVQLVGEDETEVENGKISWKSPIGTALLGKSVDDDVKVQTPVGVKRLTVIEVRYE